VARGGGGGGTSKTVRESNGDSTARERDPNSEGDESNKRLYAVSSYGGGRGKLEMKTERREKRVGQGKDSWGQTLS